MAWPLANATFAQITVPPSLKVTLPVGVAPLPVTAAPNVTVAPEAAGFSEEVNVVVLTLFAVNRRAARKMRSVASSLPASGTPTPERYR